MARGFRDDHPTKGVRPGQLMLCVGAMHHQLSHTDSDRADPMRVELLEAIQREGMLALQDIVQDG